MLLVGFLLLGGLLENYMGGMSLRKPDVTHNRVVNISRNKIVYMDNAEYLRYMAAHVFTLTCFGLCIVVVLWSVLRRQRTHQN